MGNLVADDALRERKRVRAAYLDDAARIHGDGKAAGIGAVQGADGVALDACHLWLRGVGSRRDITSGQSGRVFAQGQKNMTFDFTRFFRFGPKKYILK